MPYSFCPQSILVVPSGSPGCSGLNPGHLPCLLVPWPRRTQCPASLRQANSQPRPFLPGSTHPHSRHLVSVLCPESPRGPSKLQSSAGLPPPRTSVPPSPKTWTAVRSLPNLAPPPFSLSLHQPHPLYLHGNQALCCFRSPCLEIKPLHNPILCISLHSKVVFLNPIESLRELFFLTLHIFYLF